MAAMGRAKVAGAVMAAFAGGVLLASNLEWPREGFAQAGRTVGGVPNGPRDDGGAPGFADVAEKVVPAVVSIEVMQSAERPDAQNAHSLPPRTVLMSASRRTLTLRSRRQVNEL